MSKEILQWRNDDADDRPLPEIVIDNLGGQIATIDTPEGERLYCVRDWVYYISESKNKNLSAPWSDLKKSMRNKKLFHVLNQIKTIKYMTNGGNQFGDFASAKILNLIEEYIRVAGQNKSLSEIVLFHPNVIEYFRNNNYDVRHHVHLPSGKIIDIVAQDQEITLIVECKPTLSGQRLYTAIGQAICYAGEYGYDSIPVIATQRNQIDDYVIQMCNLAGVELITLDADMSSTDLERSPHYH